MANYNFGEQILRSIQMQDQLNQRKQDSQTQQSHWNAQMAFRQRQADLTNQHWNTNYAFDIAQFDARQSKDFQAGFTRVSDVPPDIGGQIQSNQVLSGAYLKSQGFKAADANTRYIPTPLVTNIEQHLARLEQVKRDNQNSTYQNASLEVSQGNLQLGKDRLAFDKSKIAGASAKGQVTQTTKAKLFGDVAANLQEYQLTKGFTENLPKNSGLFSDGDKGNLTYISWKSSATGNIARLLKAVNLPITGNVVNVLRSDLNVDNITDMMLVNNPSLNEEAVRQEVKTALKNNTSTPEIDKVKREVLDTAIRIYSSDHKLTDEQLHALQYWKEIGTR